MGGLGAVVKTDMLQIGFVLLTFIIGLLSFIKSKFIKSIISSALLNIGVADNKINLVSREGDTVRLEYKANNALSIKEIVKIPIKFMTYGEKIDHIEKFDPEQVARRILGLDDIVGLVEKAQQSFDEKKAKKLHEKIGKNKFDLNDFRSQLDQFKDFGDINQMVKYIPKMKKISNLDMNEKKIVWIKAIIDSMTNEERMNPSLINGSRKKRISIGCGRPVNEINQLLKQFNQMKLMMNKMKNMGSLKFPFGGFK